MPFVSVSTAMPTPKETMNTLQQEIGRIIALIPGKNIDNCMTRIEGGADIFMSGAAAKAVFCEVRVYGEAPKDSKAAVVAELHALFTTQLGAEKVYTHFIESKEWGSGANYNG